MNRTNVKNLVMTALFVALGLLLPMAFHAFGLGKAFLPMHIPVLMCGLICGPRMGALCGAVTPLLSAALTGMPVLFPTGVAMVFELAVYGAMTGLLYRNKRWNIYAALIVAMLVGKAVAGCANAVFLGVAGDPYSFSIYLNATFVTTLPGIVVQLVFVPLLVKILEKARAVAKPVPPVV